MEPCSRRVRRREIVCVCVCEFLNLFYFLLHRNDAHDQFIYAVASMYIYITTLRDDSIINIPHVHIGRCKILLSPVPRAALHIGGGGVYLKFTSFVVVHVVIGVLRLLVVVSWQPLLTIEYTHTHTYDLT